MIYLFIGDDKDAKDRKIAQIKAKYLTDDSALKLDYESLLGTKLDPDILKKALISLPAVSKRRLILIRSVDKLDTHNKKIILDFIQTENHHAVIILDSDELSAKNSFFNKINAVARVMRFTTGRSKLNVFDMTRAMEKKDSVGALKILAGLFDDGNHPLQIMGGIVWFWGKLKNRLSREAFTKGLIVLQEADLSIKRSRLKPEYAVEVAITKLNLLIAC